MKHILNNITINYEHFDEVDSTQILARKALDNMSYNEYYLASASNQKAPIGTGGKLWHSLSGNLGISLSFIVNAQEHIKLLPFVAAIALNQFLGNMAIHSNIKWPNDILVGGRKIAGILTQSYSGAIKDDPNAVAVCIGVGLNVNASSEDLQAIDQKATSIFIESNVKYDVMELSKNLGIILIENIQSFLDGKMPNLISLINERLEKFENNLVRIKLNEDSSETGVIRKINHDGTINLKMADGFEKSFAHGSISLI